MRQDVPETEAAVLDMDSLVERCLGNLSLAERVLAKFLSAFEQDLSELEQAVLAGDGELAASISHRLKGSSASAGANALRDRMARIEEISRQGQMPQMNVCLEDVRGEWRRFTELAATFH